MRALTLDEMLYLAAFGQAARDLAHRNQDPERYDDVGGVAMWSVCHERDCARWARASGVPERVLAANARVDAVRCALPTECDGCQEPIEGAIYNPGCHYGCNWGNAKRCTPADPQHERFCSEDCAIRSWERAYERQGEQ